MPEIITYVSVFLIGLFANFIGSMVGSGGLLIISFLVFIGLPPQIAIATNKLGTFGLYIGATPKFLKAKKIHWKYVPIFILISLLGAYIGANILLSISNEILTKIIGIIVLLMVPILLIKNNLGVKHHKVNAIKKLIGYFAYFLIMIFAGFFGGGAATLMFFSLMFFFGFTINEANGTTTIPWLFLSLASLIIFAINGIVDYGLGITLLIGSIIGGRIGAHTAIEKGNKWVKAIFIGMLIISGIKFLFFG